MMIRIVAMMVPLLVPGSIVLAGDVVSTTAVEDAYLRLESGQTFLAGSRILAGRNAVACFAFEGLDPLSMAAIEQATLEVHCKSCRKPNVRLKVCGEYSRDPAPLLAKQYDLQRTWTRQCSTLDAGRGPRNDWFSLDAIKPVQEVVAQDGWSGRMVLCLLPAGGRAVHQLDALESGGGDFAARLTVGYVANSNSNSNSIVIHLPKDKPCFAQDTNGDLLADEVYDNADGDFAIDGRELCDLPVGTRDISGALRLDGAFEFTGTDIVTGLTLRRGTIQIAENTRIISDFMSPVVTAPGALEAAIFEILAEASIVIEAGAVISNIGTIDGERAGPVILGTTLPHAGISVDSASLAARNIDMTTQSDINLDGAVSLVSLGTIRLIAVNGGTINISGDASIFVGSGANLILRTQGDAIIGENALIVGDVDACDVEGQFKTDNPTVAPQDIIFGDVMSRDLANCPP